VKTITTFSHSQRRELRFATTRNFHTYTRIDDSCTNFANVDWVVVTSAAFRVWVNKGRILPGLWKTTVVEKDVTLLELTQHSLLFILLNGCEFFIRGDFILLPTKYGNPKQKLDQSLIRKRFASHGSGQTYLVNFGISHTKLKYGVSLFEAGSI
jgi:hypothetical protein